MKAKNQLKLLKLFDIHTYEGEELRKKQRKELADLVQFLGDVESGD